MSLGITKNLFFFENLRDSMFFFARFDMTSPAPTVGLALSWPGLP